MIWSAGFPLWQRTLDGRRILSLSIERPLPLPLMCLPGDPPGIDVNILSAARGRGHAGSYTVGKITHAAFNAGRQGATVWLSGVLERTGFHPWPGDVWYLVPDLGTTLVVQAQGEMRMDGDLLACTLVEWPSWRGQRPVTFG